MLIEHDTLDDLLHEALQLLTSETQLFEATRGRFKELLGCSLHLKNPRARLSRSEDKGKIFSALGELFWYLSGDTRLDFIDYYIPNRFQRESDDQVQVRSGYGERLLSFRGINQIQNVIGLLREKPTSRRAVIQLFDASDLETDYASIPCTCTLQFLARNGHLNLFVSMRSNDAYIGLPHDVFAFTMLQELVARSLGMELGEYFHFAGSLHLYEENFESAAIYLREGWQSRIAMPPMPVGDPWSNIERIRGIEETIRLGADANVETESMENYWKDLIRLLQAYQAARKKDVPALSTLLRQMDSNVYDMFVQARLDRLTSGGYKEMAAEAVP